jgi:hypothetical protein
VFAYYSQARIAEKFQRDLGSQFSKQSPQGESLPPKLAPQRTFIHA